jgi:two-component system sensor histidine kinase and response regulator WspE
VVAEPAIQVRVLVVEDNELVRDMFAHGVRRYFSRHGYDVAIEFARDGAEAWARLPGGDYDLAIVDHYMPVMGGAQLVERIRGDAALKSLPIVVVSAGADDVRDACLAAGADVFLRKPLQLRELVATLAALTREVRS